MLDDVTLALLGDRAARRENPALTEASSPAQAAVKTRLEAIKGADD